MKHLNKKSSAVLQKLIDCMSDPDYAKTMGSFEILPEGTAGKGCHKLVPILSQ